MGATKQTAHTPTPWEACGNLVRTARTDVDPSGLLVCDCPANVGNRIEDAAFIVRACNAHDELVAAGKRYANAKIEGGPDAGAPLLHCLFDVLNPCWNGRATDVIGKHWSGGESCPACHLRAALAKAGAA